MSRLVENSERIRNDLESRNLYTPEDPYNLDSGRLVESINRLANIISPFDSIDIINTIVGRLAFPQVNTPLTEIGLQMLSKQFAATVKSLGRAEAEGTFNFSNVFDNNPNTRLIVNNQITRDDDQSFLGRLLEELTGNYRAINPFQNNPTPSEYFRQTGRGQQQFLIQNINRNIYRKSNDSWLSTIEDEGYVYTQVLNREFFSGINQQFNPFDQYRVLAVDKVNRRLNNEFVSFRNNIQNEENYFEYGASESFRQAHGKLTKRNNTIGGYNHIFNVFSNVPLPFGGGGSIDLLYNDYGLNDNPNIKFVWGRDGVSDLYEGERNGLDKNPNANPNANGNNSTINDYNPNTDRFTGTDAPRTGLLNYTKELLNSKGRFGSFDLTKKKFIDRENGNVHFNGSPLSSDLNNSENRSRQHNVTDPYNRYVKAIRYRGNELYGGNENSVINKRVIPKIHPVRDEDGTINIKNLMFSIENLAAPVFRDDANGVAYLDDEFGTQLPFCEAGEFGGRLMWFAPYDIKFSEQSLARHETTMFLGRSEPIYTYNNSERIGKLSFKLLIDYPPQVRGLSHIDASKFFAFGGSGIQRPQPINIDQKRNELKIITDQRDSITPTTENIRPDPDTINTGTEFNVYFPNDVPKVGQVNGSIQNYVFNQGYEITNNDIDGKNYRLNDKFDKNFDNTLNTVLAEGNREFIQIEIVGQATQLYLRGDNDDQVAYNNALSQRRAEALREYINTYYRTNISNGKSLFDDGIQVIIRSSGSTNATDITANPDSIPTREAKSFRVATVNFKQNQNTLNRERELTEEQRRQKQELDEQITNLDTQIKKAEEQLSRGFECTFNQYTIEDGILKGFQSTQVNKFQPVFHSQTPEDFHRRLTFLQQCVRQGNAIRETVNPEDNTTSTIPKNSVFGRQPVQILRLGDFMHTKIIIDNISFDYSDYPWDLNPEGMGAQFMIADIDIQMKIIGGQSLATPIDALQNAVSFNYYANSTYYNNGVYQTPTRAENAQLAQDKNIRNENNDSVLQRNDTINNIVNPERKAGESS